MVTASDGDDASVGLLIVHVRFAGSQVATQRLLCTEKGWETVSRDVTKYGAEGYNGTTG